MVKSWHGTKYVCCSQLIATMAVFAVRYTVPYRVPYFIQYVDKQNVGNTRYLE